MAMPVGGVWIRSQSLAVSGHLISVAAGDGRSSALRGMSTGMKATFVSQEGAVLLLPLRSWKGRSSSVDLSGIPLVTGLQQEREQGTTDSL